MNARCIEIALAIEKAAEDEDASIVVMAMCWVLADLIIQVERVKGRPAHESLTALLNQLIVNIDRLREIPEEAEIPEDAVH
jgi:hypothetical protein